MVSFILQNFEVHYHEYILKSSGILKVNQFFQGVKGYHQCQMIYWIFSDALLRIQQEFSGCTLF